MKVPLLEAQVLWWNLCQSIFLAGCPYDVARQLVETSEFISPTNCPEIAYIDHVVNSKRESGFMYFPGCPTDFFYSECVGQTQSLYRTLNPVL